MGVNIERSEDNDSYHLSQPHLIEQILKDLRLSGDDVVTKPVPAAPDKVLGRFPKSPAHDNSFHYRSVLGKLNYLEKSSRPDISYAVHQCARFSGDPKVEHTKAVKHIGRYLKKTELNGYFVKPTDDSFQVYADADFCGTWKQDEAEDDPDTVRSRTGFVITYLGCPILWKSTLQGEHSLSTTEAEYIALSQALRKVIPLMDLVSEMKEKGYDVGHTKPTIKCTLFEDNSGALTLAKAPAMRPCTKHINCKYHHFRSAVAEGRIGIEKCASEDMWADIFTKALGERLFVKQRKSIMGW